MTDTRTFRIRKAFLAPLGLLLVLCLILLGVTLAQGQPPAKAMILSFIILPVAGLFVESLFRRTVIGPDSVTVHKLLRRSTLPLSGITSVDTVMVRKRVFLTVSAGEDFLIMSNAYDDFPGLVQTLLARVPEEAVAEETRDMAASPPSKSSDIVSCWLAVALLLLILYGQIGKSL